MTVTHPTTLTTLGRVLEKSDEHVVLALPETSWRVHLLLEAPLETPVGEEVIGTVHGQAMRVDVVRTGGRFIEPVYGRPRRVQGRIIGGDVNDNVIVVDCGVKLFAQLNEHQKAGDFMTQQIVAFDVKSGSTFRPVEA